LPACQQAGKLAHIFREVKFLFPNPNPSQHDFQSPGVVFQPETFQGLLQGIDRLVSAIRPTLGPFPRLVAVESTPSRSRAPEILDSGGTIARRIIEIEGRNADMGAMFLRHMLWKLQEKAGDGTATAAVIFHTLFVRGVRYVTAGGNAMLLRKYLEQGLRLVLDELSRQTVMLDPEGGPASRKEILAGLAESICGDAELAGYLGEIFDIIGAYGRLEVRPGSERQFKRDYVEGIYWENGLHSRNMLDDPLAGRSALENAVVVISNLDLEDPQDMVHVLEVGLQAEAGGLLLVASSVSDRALSVALMKPNRDKFKVLAVKTPGVATSVQENALLDLAVLTGGRPLQKATLDTFQGLKASDLGRARRIYAGMDYFNIIGGRGNPRQFRAHVRGLQEAYRLAQEPSTRLPLQMRIGQLMGGSATLYTGGLTRTECEARRAVAERTATVIRNAMLEGVVPGGGVALLAVRPRLAQALRQARNDDERAAYTLLLEAVEAPFRALLANAGFDSGQIMARLAKTGAGVGFNLKAGKLQKMAEAGIVDPAFVLKEAVRSAIGSAALLLTTDTLVHLKNPPQELET
jgi:chaperonin GroEL